MKSKITALVLLLCMVFSSNAVFAEDETTPEANDKIINNSTEIIPVHGYVGPFEVVIPPDPEVEIYVEAPIKILFSAFDSDNGMVTSPKYVITNLSEKTDIKVEIESFAQQFDENASLDGQLSLKLVTHSNEDLVTELFPSDYTAAKLMSEKLNKNIDDGSNSIGFMIGGSWLGDFEQEIKPIFDMTMKFSAAK